MLDIARGRAAELGIDITLIEADAQQLLFADHRFDTVVCTLALSSIPESAAAINEMYRVLRPGGQLLVVGRRKPLPSGESWPATAKDCRFAWPVIIDAAAIPRNRGCWLHR